jgi:hypothetical protein
MMPVFFAYYLGKHLPISARRATMRCPDRSNLRRRDLKAVVRALQMQREEINSVAFDFRCGTHITSTKSDGMAAS